MLIQVLSQQQLDMYDRVDKASLLRQEQLLKAQSLQSVPYEGASRYDKNIYRIGHFKVALDSSYWCFCSWLYNLIG